MTIFVPSYTFNVNKLYNLRSLILAKLRKDFSQRNPQRLTYG